MPISHLPSKGHARPRLDFVSACIQDYEAFGDPGAFEGGPTDLPCSNVEFQPATFPESLRCRCVLPGLAAKAQSGCLHTLMITRTDVNVVPHASLSEKPEGSGERNTK